MEADLQPTEASTNATAADHSELYSKQAITGFAVFFSTIFGAVLLRQNLLDIGNKKAANQVLLISIGCTIAEIVLLNSWENIPNAMVYVLNFAGISFLIEVFHKKYFLAHTPYKNKKVWKPLLISILITVPFLLAIIYSAVN